MTPRVENATVAHIRDNLRAMSDAAAVLSESELAQLDVLAASAKCWKPGVCPEQ